MRIAFYAPRASYLEPGISGDKILVASLLAGLRQKGHEVKIASRLNAGDLWRSRVPAHRLATEVSSVRRTMTDFSPDAWLIFASSFKYPDLFGWWQCPKRYVIYRTHLANRELPSGWRWLFKTAHRRSLDRADMIAVSEPRIASRLGQYGVPADRLTFLPPWGRSWDWIPPREQARSYLGLPQDAPVILCVSRLTEGEDDRKPGKTQMVLNLVAMIAHLPRDVILLIVGDGRGRRQLETQASALISEGRVRLFGTVEDLKWFYAACSFFAFPDLHDRPRLAILEAQGCGRPVVTTRSLSAERIIEAGCTGLLAKDLEEFQTLVAELVHDRTRCECMGRAAQEYVAKFHSPEARISQIEDLLLAQRK
jgi:glycosyltransferase involved in cell wall biosynthesis